MNLLHTLRNALLCSLCSGGLSAQMLIVSAPEYMEEMKPFVAWKTQRGMEVQLVSTAETGHTQAELKQYVAEHYATHHNRYLLLVGDATQVPTHISYGITNPTSASAYSDSEYGYLTPGSYPPQILVGRFSAESAADVRTQVERSVAYERDITSSATWLERAIGITDPRATELGDNNETDIQHIRKLNKVLAEYGYSTEEVSTKSKLLENLRNGCGLIQYVGHGYQSSWGTTGFNTTDVAGLSNTGRLPIIISAACLNGHFRLGTCLGEALLRARTTEGQATGATAIMAFSTSIHWNPPMLGQDEFTRILTTTETLPNEKKTLGEVMNAAYRQVIATYKGSGEDVSQQWILFGDPSLMLRSKAPALIEAELPATIVPGSSELKITKAEAGTIAALSKGEELLACDTLESHEGILHFPAQEIGEKLRLVLTAFDGETRIQELTVDNPTGIQSVQAAMRPQLTAGASAGEFTLSGISPASARIQIYDTDSRLLEEYTAEEGSTIRLSLPAGVYLVQILTGDTRHTQKIRIER